MNNKKELLQTLKQEIELLQYKINKTNDYNKNVIKKRAFYKVCGFIDSKIMYIIAYIACLNFSIFKNNSPFIMDKVECRPSIEEIYTSEGDVTTKESKDIEYKDNLFAYTTDWYVNEMGLYEQKTTYYQYNEIKDAKPDDILSITKEALDAMFTITDVKRTVKNSLTEEELADKPMLKISFSEESDKKYYRNEYWWELIVNFIIYIVLSELMGIGLTVFKVAITKNKNQEKIQELIEQTEIVSEYDKTKLRKILKIKLANYELLTSDDETERLIRRN